MHITILAIGSRGDIVPYIALSQGLMSAGHMVRLATHQAFAELVRSYNIPFFALDDEPGELFQTEVGEKLLAYGTNPYRFAQQFAQWLAARTPLYMQRSQQACQDADVVVVAFISLMIGYTLAEKYKKKLVMTLLQPTLLSTAALPEPTSPWLPQKPPLLGKAMNRLSHVMAQQYTRLLFLPAANAARKSLYNLPPLSRSFYATLPDIADLVLCAYSPLLVPRPADWSENIHVTGFWTLKHQEAWRPESDLVAFLHAGSAPIYIGFGSMNSYHPAETIAVVEAALRQVGQRGILLVDKDVSLSQKHSDILYLTNGVAHDWLFPQMQAIVHHGGAGTTAASLSAGVPTIIIPSISDQWFWGYQVARAGVGPQPISRKNLTTQELVERLNTTLRNQEMRQRAKEMGEHIRKENGVEQGVKNMGTLETHDVTKL
jgi:UDP:flavonoid glycosyltransferase YjiC (YdhE family)